MMNSTDEQLYQRILEGQRSAFDQLYERHSQSLFGFIRKFLESQQLSEDVLQETFIKVFKGQPLDFSQGSFRGWLYMIARNSCIDLLRKNKKKMLSINEIHTIEYASETEQERMNLIHRIRSVALQLPNPLNQLFKLKAAGLSNKEISEIQNVPVGTVKSRLNKMINLIKEEVDP